jgi:hypothetical protein
MHKSDFEKIKTKKFKKSAKGAVNAIEQWIYSEG